MDYDDDDYDKFYFLSSLRMLKLYFQVHQTLWKLSEVEQGKVKKIKITQQHYLLPRLVVSCI